MNVFVVRKRSQVPGGSQGSRGRPRVVSGTSPGRPRGVPRGPRGIPGGPRSVPRGPRACSGDPRDSRGLRRRPGHHRDPFHEDESVVHDIIP